MWLSRATSQNKELKAQIAELQDAFVRLSQQNMELASDLDTERLRVAQLNTRPPQIKGNPIVDTATGTKVKGNPPTELLEPMGIPPFETAVLTETDGNLLVEQATPTEETKFQDIQVRVF